MLFKTDIAKPAVSLLLASWVAIFSFCGIDAFIPVVLEIPHHASHSVNAGCEQVCLASSLASHEAIIGQQIVRPLPTDLQSGAPVAYPLLSVPKGFSHLRDRVSLYPASTKRYQLISTYRL
jgi:hypothetical protein